LNIIDPKIDNCRAFDWGRTSDEIEGSGLCQRTGCFGRSEDRLNVVLCYGIQSFIAACSSMSIVLSSLDSKSI